ncbi:rCG25855 [Rattus norvegicus]|uniref:RCG25855 n=1 Tax=Rattus norvegicus TaxID=10116 RepID=A6I2B5_RAT|nr:rCG25855 [Rattus norvegicus]
MKQWNLPFAAYKPLVEKSLGFQKGGVFISSWLLGDLCASIFMYKKLGSFQRSTFTLLSQ